MRTRLGLSQHSIRIILGLIFLAIVILISSLSIVKNNGEKGELTVPLQDNDSAVITSSATSLTGKISQTQTIDQQTQIPLDASNSICAAIWGIKTPTTLPEWLRTPSTASGLKTDVKYFILAGHLISSGIINANACPDGGLSSSGAANTCGMEQAYNEVVEWQNQFDQDIFTAAQDNQIPAEVLKRLFAQETQFWPPNYFGPPAYGIGNVMSPGIEPLFIWNDDVYQNTCREVFSKSCTQPYSALSSKDQQVIRGFFISHYIDAYCDTCLNKIDLDKTKRSIDYFAKLIIADCHQVVSDINHVFSIQTLPYEDAWRLTLLNYAVGPTCITTGMEEMDSIKGFSWEYFTEKLASNCNADTYLNNITQ